MAHMARNNVSDHSWLRVEASTAVFAVAVRDGVITGGSRYGMRVAQRLCTRDAFAFVDHCRRRGWAVTVLRAGGRIRGASASSSGTR